MTKTKQLRQLFMGIGLMMAMGNMPVAGAGGPAEAALAVEKAATALKEAEEVYSNAKEKEGRALKVCLTTESLTTVRLTTEGTKQKRTAREEYCQAIAESAKALKALEAAKKAKAKAAAGTAAGRAVAEAEAAVKKAEEVLSNERMEVNNAQDRFQLCHRENRIRAKAGLEIALAKCTQANIALEEAKKALARAKAAAEAPTQATP